MALEVERRFLVDAPPGASMLGPGIAICQGYLAEEGDVAVRVRITADDATLTVKAGAGIARTEVEHLVDRDDAEALWRHTEGRRIEKVRHRVPTGSAVAEVDVFGGRLAGLCIVEVEFDDVDAAARFTPPPWFGREVTSDPRWSNASLARHGAPP